jgi:RecA/RadA recombinase
MVPQSALIDMKTKKDKDMADRNMNDNTALARATSAHFPAFNLVLRGARHLRDLPNQIRMKIGVVYGDPRKTPGGEAPFFYDTHKLMLGAAAKITKGKGDAGGAGRPDLGRGRQEQGLRPFRKALALHVPARRLRPLRR